MKLMSFHHTQEQMKAHTKTVTRRLGWRFLKPGAKLCAVNKRRGLGKGEKYIVLAVIEVVSVRQEMLCDVTDEDVIREGFPGMTREEFIKHFCEKMETFPRQNVTRIEFKFLNQDGTPSG